MKYKSLAKNGSIVYNLCQYNIYKIAMRAGGPIWIGSTNTN